MNIKNLFKRPISYISFNTYKSQIETKATLQWQQKTREQSLNNILKAEVF